MVVLAKKNLKDSGIDTDTIGVPGSFEIPYEIARSIKEDTIINEYKVGSFKGKGKEEIRDNIVQIAKLSQLNDLVFPVIFWKLMHSFFLP